MAFHYLPFVNRLKAALFICQSLTCECYLHSDIHGLFVDLQSANIVSSTCGVAILKHRGIIFSKKNITDHLSNCGPAAHVLEFPFPPLLPFELVIRAFSWRSGFAFETSSCQLRYEAVLSKVKAWEVHRGKHAHWNEPNTDPNADARAESLTPCWRWWQVMNPVHSREEEPLLFGTKGFEHFTCSRAGSRCVQHQICHWLSSAEFKIKWQQISGAYKRQLGIRRVPVHLNYRLTHTLKLITRIFPLTLKLDSQVSQSFSVSLDLQYTGPDSDWKVQSIPWSGN